MTDTKLTLAAQVVDLGMIDRGKLVSEDVYLSVLQQRDAHFKEIERARKIIELVRDQRHSACVALMAAEATLALCSGKLPGYAERRRVKTLKIVRASLQESGYSND